MVGLNDSSGNLNQNPIFNSPKIPNFEHPESDSGVNEGVFSSKFLESSNAISTPPSNLSPRLNHHTKVAKTTRRKSSAGKRHNSHHGNKLKNSVQQRNYLATNAEYKREKIGTQTLDNSDEIENANQETGCNVKLGEKQSLSGYHISDCASPSSTIDDDTGCLTPYSVTLENDEMDQQQKIIENAKNPKIVPGDLIEKGSNRPAKDDSLSSTRNTKLIQNNYCSLLGEFEKEIEAIKRQEQEASASNSSNTTESNINAFNHLIGRYKARFEAIQQKLRQLKGELKLLSFTQIEEILDNIIKFADHHPKL